jgi:hypothetical protein
MIQYIIDCIMNDPLLIETSVKHKQGLEKQEKWRQQQIDIFYRTGKPIFTMTFDTMHIRSHNNVHYYVDPYFR